MPSITVTAAWCMGHRLPNHQGGCSALHGHQYTAEVTVRGSINMAPGAPDEGMVVDFKTVKEDLRRIIANWDHRFMLSGTDPLLPLMAALPGVIAVSFTPTAENLAQALLDALPEASRVKLWETPTSFSEVWR